mmetsp:Transcript_18713/g.22413  ORF Transcript_18713/g.22413 Transcript_18713/m.22413 type:complete len:185 (-) Transcript_18713:341-895(-)
MIGISCSPSALSLTHCPTHRHLSSGQSIASQKLEHGCRSMCRTGQGKCVKYRASHFNTSKMGCIASSMDKQEFTHVAGPGWKTSACRFAATGYLFTAIFSQGDWAAAAADIAAPVPVEQSPLIQELLARSAENKEKYDKERLDSYNERNFKDYFNYYLGAQKKEDANSQLSQQMKQFVEETEKQ